MFCDSRLPFKSNISEYFEIIALYSLGLWFQNNPNLLDLTNIAKLEMKQLDRVVFIEDKFGLEIGFYVLDVSPVSIKIILKII